MTSRHLVALAVLAGAIAASAAYALPVRVVPRVLSGGGPAVLIMAACSVAFCGLVWQHARHGCRRSWGDATAGLLVVVAYAMFHQNQLVFLFPLIAALAWLAARMGRGVDGALPLSRRTLCAVVAGLGLLHVVQAVLARQSDVGEAVMTGARALAAGRSPYSDPATEALAGTTYGPFAYELYAPAAALLPLHAGQHLMGVLGHLVLGVAVWLAGRRAAGTRGALLALAVWLAFPAAAHSLAVSAHDDWVAALVLLGLVAASPVLAGVLLGLAAMVKLYPALLLPLWLGRFRSSNRAQAAVLAGFAIAVAATMLPVLAVEPGGAQAVFDASLRNQATRLGIHIWNVPPSQWWPNPLDVPYNFGFLWDPQAPVLQTIARLVAVGIAIFLARVPAGTEPAGLAARAACTVLVLQLVLSNWSWNYVSWFAPLIAVAFVARGVASPGTPATAQPTTARPGGHGR